MRIALEETANTEDIVLLKDGLNATICVLFDISGNGSELKVELNCRN